MLKAAAQLPDDVDALKTLVDEQAAQLVKREVKIELLQERIRLLLAGRYAATSERVESDTQLGLFNEAEAEVLDAEHEEPTVQVPAHIRRRRGRRPLPDDLPRESVIHDLSESERVCPHDGSALEHFGEENSEQLDIVPAKVRVLVHRRLKYRCACCEAYVKTAPMVPQPLPKSQASPV